MDDMIAGVVCKKPSAGCVVSSGLLFTLMHVKIVIADVHDDHLHIFLKQAVQ